MRVRIGQTEATSSAAPVLAEELVVEDVIFKAHPSNSGVVFVGEDDGVDDESGWPLVPGEELVVAQQIATGGLAIDLNEFYVYAAGTERLAWVATPR